MLAGRALAAARALAEPAGYGGVQARIALVDAALRRAGDDDAGAIATLDAALAVAPTPMTSLDTQLLRAARAGHAPAGLPDGLERLVAALGFRGAPRYQVRGRDGHVAAASVARVPVGEHDLVVDLPRHAIEAPLLGRGVRGHPVGCALLAQLVEHDPVGVGAEPLYLGVWRGREYHPLRHRNTVYVGISRLRRALAEVLPGRTVIETTPTGWRLARGVRAVVIDVAP
ncbi:MAG: helix-turn-helix domain-containing protein [Kofleriaceae bacterium]|nr:helix-turn-helix domain-containing protein [Kofleriaceae bacterium]